MRTAALKSWTATLSPRASFFVQFLTHPGMLGAFAPSSGRLADEMIRGVDLGPGARIAEYGPGTGVFTRAILGRLHPDAAFFAIERNEALAAQLRRRFPGLRLHTGSAEDVGEYCRREGITRLDAVVCGLPWASFGEELQRRILAATAAVLRPGGTLVLCGYPLGLLTPAGRRFYRLLPESFSSIRRGRLVWRNLPPAFAVRCTRA